MSPRAATRRSAGRTRQPATRAVITPKAAASYLEESERPGTSLLLLLPLIAIYELYSAGLIGNRASGAVSHITAFLLLEQFFRLLGAAGRHLPAFALVVMLLTAHIWRKDRWRIHPGTFFGMLVESIVWAAPLLVIGWVMARHIPLASGAGNWAILCVGAGIYEEMVFRLIGVSILLVIVKDLFGLRPGISYTLVLIVTGLGFALYHYLSPGEDFRVRTAMFRTVAGAYFGGLFVVRGFGITALCHTAYDIVVVELIVGG